MPISVDLKLGDKFSGVFDKFEAQARGAAETLDGVDRKALLAQNAILKALERQAKARKDLSGVERYQDAQKSNLISASKALAGETASRKVTQEEKAAAKEKRENERKLAAERKREQKDRLSYEKYAQKEYEVNRAIKRGSASGRLQGKIGEMVESAPKWAFKAAVEKATSSLIDLAASIVSGTVAMIDWSIRTKAVERAYLGSTDAANKSTEAYMRQAAFLGKSSEEVAAFNVRMRNIGYGDEQRRSLTYLVADMDALGLKSSALVDALEMSRQAELKGFGRVQMLDVFNKLESAGFDLAQVQKQMGDTRPFKTWYREMLSQPVKAGDVWKIFGQQVTSLTSKPLGDFANETRGIEGAFNELKTKWLSTIAAVDWQPMTKALGDLSGKIFTDENMSRMASWIANANKQVPKLFDALLDGARDFIGALDKAGRFLSDPWSYVRGGSDENTGAGPGRSTPSSSAKSTPTGKWALPGNWSGGEVVGVRDGIAQVRAAPGEGLVSIGKGETIIPRGKGGGIVVNATINVNGNASGIDMYALREAICNLLETEVAPYA